jgi:hypothetical protein
MYGQSKIARTGQQKQDSWDQTARKGQLGQLRLGQDGPNMTHGHER